MKTVAQHSLLKSVFLHLLPGAVIALLVWLVSRFLIPPELPKALGFYLVALVFMPVIFILIIKTGTDSGKISESIEYKEKIPFIKMIIFSLISLVFAIAVFVLTKPLASALQSWAFSIIGDYFDIADYLVNPGNYSKRVLILTWVLALISTSTTLPVLEEVYFRGYLLPRIDRFGILTPVLGAVLFSVYHFFSFWLIPIRIVATLPMIYFVWKYRNIKIGIIAHIILNLAGDSISAIPIIFS